MFAQVYTIKSKETFDTMTKVEMPELDQYEIGWILEFMLNGDRKALCNSTNVIYRDVARNYCKDIGLFSKSLDETTEAICEHGSQLVPHSFDYPMFNGQELGSYSIAVTYSSSEWVPMRIYRKIMIHKTRKVNSRVYYIFQDNDLLDFIMSLRDPLNTDLEGIHLFKHCNDMEFYFDDSDPHKPNVGPMMAVFQITMRRFVKDHHQEICYEYDWLVSHM